MELNTPRLRMPAMTPDAMRALLDGVPPHGQRWADGYPMESTLVAAAIQLDHLKHGVDRGPFGLFQVVVRADDLVIGDVRFDHPPDDLGEVGIAFAVVPVAQGRGFAVEALGAVLRWALRRPEIRCIHGESASDNVVSHAVMVEAGMRPVSESGGRRLFEVHAG